MQQSWRLDHDKLTFIICRAPSTPCSSNIVPGKNDAAEEMIGDVNLFIYEIEQEEEEEDEIQVKGVRGVVGEIEIMIAERGARRKGLAWESLVAFVGYVSSCIQGVLEEYRVGSDERSERYIKYLRVKIDKDNVASLELFGKIGFKQVGDVNYFGEVEKRMDWEEVARLSDQVRGSVVKYGE
jgi:RimJ/RimL family protein N-acetyltransferase